MRTIDNQVLAALHQIRDAIKNKECCGGGGDENNGTLLMSLIPNYSPKPDLFLYQESLSDNPIDVTNYKIDDFINLCEEKQINEIYIECLYKSSTLNAPIINSIGFYITNKTVDFSVNELIGNIFYNEFYYNNKTYYKYYVIHV